MVTFYHTPEDVIAGIPVTDEEERDFILVLLGEGAGTWVHNELGHSMSVEIVAETPPPGGEGGRRKKTARTKQMVTRKHRRGGRRPQKTAKRVVGKYMEAPRSRLVFQMGARRRVSHRRA